MSDLVFKAVEMNTIQYDSESLDIPDLATSGSDGSQTPAGTGELLPPITETTVPERPIARALNTIVRTNSRGLANANTTMLVQGVYEQNEKELQDTKTELHRAYEQLRVCNSALSSSSADLRVAEERIGSLRRIQWISGFLYVVPPVLVGIAVSSPEDGITIVDTVLLIISAIMIFMGLLAPNLFGGEKN